MSCQLQETENETRQVNARFGTIKLAILTNDPTFRKSKSSSVIKVLQVCTYPTNKTVLAKYGKGNRILT